ncbi:hypothetical protein H9Q13_06640 [Pontibacter sp. JH31]|uniref:DUF4352 domain-containing protein n=1 Tax=Pontibacter aquaedesilientis TaxID=2766980 RepID=A0ABR7XHE2_9BACT|nr:hypothetical protein [Pontibacter aquaedesilientis]MBD1396836.1 hypothetical protein [Pontibacter aquaedesilientis]
MRTIPYLLTVALLLTGCGKHLTYSSYSEESLPTNRQQVGRITLDGSYQLYVRRLYEENDGERKRLVTRRYQEAAPGGILVEIEYLLLSETKQNVIYISTISNHYRNRYAERDIPPNQLNAYDFKVILFGKLNDSGEIAFDAKRGEAVDVWSLKYGANRNFLEISGITELIKNEFQLYIPADKALREPVHFEGFKQYALIYQSTFDNTTQPPLSFSERKDTGDVASFTGTIYFVRKSRKPRNGHFENMRMYFPFDSPLSRKNQRLLSIYFKRDRIGSNPYLLFDK